MGDTEMPTKPKVFISYSWDNESYKLWVKKLADDLAQNDIQPILDQIDLVLGDPLPQFMEQSISCSDYVLILCTPNYKVKADARKGGVGYEESIITADVFAYQNHRKYITVLTAGTWDTAIPTWASGKFGIDLSTRPYSMNEFEKLIQTITGNKVTKVEKVSSTYSPLKSSPKRYVPSTSKDETEFEDIKIVEIIKDEITSPRNDGTRGSALYAIPFRLSRLPSPIWEKYFIYAWDNPSSFTSMHRPGIAKVRGSKVILDGTTIDEYKKYHHDTLQYAVLTANEQEKSYLQAQREQERRAQEKEQQFRNKIEAEVDDIVF